MDNGRLEKFGTTKCLRRIASALIMAVALSLYAFGQQSGSEAPVVVRPGAPGEPTKTLPRGTKATLTAVSPKDVEFMQGMIHHHAQAVEMTALIESRTDDKEIRLLGQRIAQSQTDEINFMKGWLAARGFTSEMDMSGGNSKHAHGRNGANEHAMMPGMLSREQMRSLAESKGREFDRLFLAGMIQHHVGALVMVKDLFDTSGSGQDAELFNFASDVDSGQRGEIKIMQTLLVQRP